jgi:hypothetical protein
MKRDSWLVRLAVLVWVTWLGLVGLMLGLLRLRVWHPHFLPVVALFTVFLVAGLALLVVGVWQLIRGPRRIYALSLLLLGLAPLGFFAGHMMYGFSLANSRQLNLNLPLKSLIPVGDAVLDLVARFSYPKRTVGERVEMISAPLPEETARQQVALMDRHIRELESRLGRTGQRRVFWVRGPVFGLGGKAVDSLCFGSRTDEPSADPASLTTLDRHEVAHVVLSQFCRMDIQPPALLVEGWAEASSGITPNALFLRAWSDWEMGQTYSLRELLGPDWYGRHETAAYSQGAVLVNYMLREFGPERFISLYTTCSPATFDEDCRRILGVTVDQLDQAYWAEIEKRIGPGGYPRYWLSSLTLGPGVNQADWDRFIADYFTATERILAPYQGVWLTADKTHSTTEPNGQTSTFRWRYEFKRSGPLRVLKVISRDREQLYLAHPEYSFQAERKAAEDAWEIRDDPRFTREKLYRRLIGHIDLIEPVTAGLAPLIELADFSRNLVNPLCLQVAKLERFSKNGRQLVRVELEDCPPGHPIYPQISLELWADDYSLAHMEYVTDTGKTWHADAVYDAHEAVPILMSTQSESRADDGNPWKSVLTVTDRRFGLIPDDAFTPDRVLDGAAADRVIAQPGPSESPGFFNWYSVPIILGVVFFVAGASLVPWARHWSTSVRYPR